VPVAVALLAVVVHSAAAGGPGIPAGERAALLEEARAFAARKGDSKPYDIQAVLTTAVRADRALNPGSTMPSCESSPSCASWPTYAVAMRGHFVCDACSVPRGARAPHGMVLTYAVAAIKPPPMWLALGFGLSDQYPNLEAAGAPVTLYRGQAGPERRTRRPRRPGS
jgi:hypothetical protein